MVNEIQEKQAFIFRIKQFEKRSIELALEQNKLLAGWSKIDLTDRSLSLSDFKERIFKAYYKVGEERRASASAGNGWRFIREMIEGDYVIVPYNKAFYLCKVLGPTKYDSKAIDYDAAHQRSVKWLNDKQPIPRNHAAAKLQLRMKARQSCIRASDLISEIEDVLENDSTFDEDLQAKLIEITCKEIVEGKMNDWDFEKLVKTILDNLTSGEATIIPRQKDKGADIITKVSIADIGEYTLAVQVKHHDPSKKVTDIDVIDQLIEGMLIEDADIGWVVSSGTFADSMVEYKEQKEEDENLKIELIDGERLAEIIVKNGLKILD